MLKFLGLGARACLAGRAYLYGLGAAGDAGVTKALELMRDELDVAMALTGTTRVSDIGPQVIVGGERKKPTRKR